MPEKKARSVALPMNATGPVIDDTVWYAQGLRFACTQCGNCCSGAPGFVWVTMADMERIAAHLQLEFDDFTRRYVRLIGSRYSLTEKANHDCTFLTRNGGKSQCSIYPVRPTQCRTWPFWDDNLKSPSAWEGASERCPGMCAGDTPRHDLEHIEKCRQDPGSPH